MNKAGTYLLVHPSFTVEAFHGVVYSMLLQLTSPGTGTHGVDYYEKWSDGETIVEWLEVGPLESTFVWFISPDPKSTEMYLSEKLFAKSVGELVVAASQPDVEHNELVRLLYRIAYMSPKISDDVLTLFEQMIQDTRPTIRQAALNGYMIRRWALFWNRVVEVEAQDPEDEVRITARKVLELGPLR